jgi:hypothetical protein
VVGSCVAGIVLDSAGACAWQVCISVECRAGTLLRLEWEKSGAGEAPELRASVECGSVDSVWCRRRSV